MAFESPGLELQGGLWSVAASIHASLNLLSAMVILRQPASFSTPIRSIFSGKISRAGTKDVNKVPVLRGQC